VDIDKVGKGKDGRDREGENELGWKRGNGQRKGG